MQVIAITKDGLLISATGNEVREVLKSVTGKTIESIEIGQKIPAIDYATSITKVRELGKAYQFTRVKDSINGLAEHFSELSKSVDEAANLEL